MHNLRPRTSDGPVGRQGSRHTRRRFLRATVAVGAGSILALSTSAIWGRGLSVVATPALAAEEPGQVTADEALKRLLDGNARYVASKAEHPAQTAERRVTVAKGQHPIAVILGCADSRVPPELLFDQGLGDLFTIRVAGNVLDNAVLGSIEYALEELHVPLVIVLGHERCGAVKATLDLAAAGGQAPGHIASLVEAIQPVVEQAKAQGGDVLDTAVIANVGHVTALLKTSHPILAEIVGKGHAKIIGGRYDLDTGEVLIVA